MNIHVGFGTISTRGFRGACTFFQGPKTAFFAKKTNFRHNIRHIKYIFIKFEALCQTLHRVNINILKFHEKSLKIGRDTEKTKRY